MYFGYSDGDEIYDGMLPGYRLIVNQDYNAVDPREYGDFNEDVNRAYVTGDVFSVRGEKLETWVRLSDVDQTDDRTWWKTREEWVDTGDFVEGAYLRDANEWNHDPEGLSAVDVARENGFDGVAPKEDE